MQLLRRGQLTSSCRPDACRSPPSPRPPTSTARAGLFPASRLPNLACAGNRHAMFTILLFREGVTTVHGKPANFPLFFVMFCSWEAAVLFCIFCGSSFMENHRLFLIIFRGLFSFIGKSRRLLLSCFALLYVFVLRAFFFCFSYTCSTFRLFSFLFFFPTPLSDTNNGRVKWENANQRRAERRRDAEITGQASRVQAKALRPPRPTPSVL